MDKLPDIQEDTKPDFPININKVGINNVKIPVVITNGGLHEQVQASVSAFVNLASDIRAISMSMFLRILKDYLYKPINRPALREMLDRFKGASKENATFSEITFNFDLSFNRTSPKSNINFPMYYSCVLKGLLKLDEFRLFKSIKVPFTSYCPCSKSLVDNVGFGISHNQRSFCDLFVELKEDIQYYQLASIVETSVINKVYPVLRRVDEQFVAMVADNNQLFVEDSIRKITHNIESNKKIKDYYIKVTHEESLHQHNAVAINWKGIENGFNENTIIIG